MFISEMFNPKKKRVTEAHDDAYTRDLKASQTGFDDSNRRAFKRAELQHELGHETNNIQIAINGKPWKVIPGKGYADSQEERAYLEGMRRWAEKKSASSGKKWTVYLTGANVSEAANPAQQAAIAIAKKKEQGVTEAPLDWQGTVSGTKQAEQTDHTFDEAIEYMKTNYPTVKQYRVRRAEPGFRSVGNSAELRKSEAHISGVDGAVDYLQLKQNSMMSGSRQITYSIGYSWMVYENRSNGIGVLYYQDRGMGADEIYIGAKTAEKHKQARQVFRDAGVLPIPKPRTPKASVAEGGPETVSMDDAVKVLRHYGADNFKTTSNELHFYKNGRPLSVDLILNKDATRSVNLSQLNAATRNLRGVGIAEAIPYALSAANSNAEFERTRTHIPRGYKGRVDTEVSSQEEYTAVMHLLNKLARAEGQHVECGLSGDQMSIFSKTMDSEALDDFVDMALEEFDQGVTEAGRAGFRAGYSRRAQLNAMTPEERAEYDKKRAEQQRKRDDARLARERQKNGVTEATGPAEALVAKIKQLMDAGAQVDSKSLGAMGHIYDVRGTTLGLKRLNKPHSKMRYAWQITPSRAEGLEIVKAGPNRYVLKDTDAAWGDDEQGRLDLPMPESVEPTHGKSPEDLGGADAWYHRSCDPAKYGFERGSIAWNQYIEGFKQSDEGPRGGKQWESKATDTDIDKCMMEMRHAGYGIK